MGENQVSSDLRVSRSWVFPPSFQTEAGERNRVDERLQSGWWCGLWQDERHTMLLGMSKMEENPPHMSLGPRGSETVQALHRWGSIRIPKEAPVGAGQDLWEHCDDQGALLNELKVHMNLLIHPHNHPPQQDGSKATPGHREGN